MVSSMERYLTKEDWQIYRPSFWATSSEPRAALAGLIEGISTGDGTSSPVLDEISKNKPILVDRWVFEAARLYPQMIIEYLSDCGKRGSSFGKRMFIRKYGVQLSNLNSKKAKLLDRYGNGKRFLVTTAKKGYTLKGLSDRVISRCFSPENQEQIRLFGLEVPSIWGFPKRRLMKPIVMDIFEELEAEAVAASHPHSAFEGMPKFLGDRSNPGYEIRPILLTGCSDHVAGSLHNVLINMAPPYHALSDPWDLAAPRSHHQMINLFSSFEDKKCSKSSFGEGYLFVCCCEICEFKRKYEVLLGESSIGRTKMMDLYGGNGRFMVTSAARDYTLTGLSDRVISKCLFQAKQEQLAASELPGPSIWDLPQERHLLKPVPKDIFQELKSEAASHPDVAFGRIPEEFHDGCSNQNNPVSPKLLSGSSDQASFLHNVIINMTPPSFDDSSDPDSGRVSFQLESIEVESPPDASSDPETGLGPNQPQRELELLSNATVLERSRASLNRPEIDQEAEPLFNRGRMTETTLVVAAQVSLTLVTNGFSGSKSLSPNGEILKQFATICNASGFLCCFCGILVFGRKPRLAARIITGLGYILTAYGFLGILGMTLNDDLKLWFTAASCIALFPVLAFAFMK